jgi:hypothetical protein
MDMNSAFLRRVQHEQAHSMRGVIAPIGGGILVGMIASGAALLSGVLIHQYAMGTSLARSRLTEQAVIELVGLGVGSLVGGLAGLHFSSRKRPLIPICVSVAITVLDGFGLIDVPMPPWFWVVGLLAGVGPGFVLGVSRRDRISMSNGVAVERLNGADSASRR